MNAKHTPGPWGWFGSQYGFQLATEHSGRRYVMTFARMGMQGAQPRFQVGGIMTDATDLALFAVGQRGVVGFDAAKREGSGVYRTDIIGFKHPDAHVIAAAPDLYEALWIATEHNALHFGESHNTVTQGRTALARARGEHL